MELDLSNLGTVNTMFAALFRYVIPHLLLLLPTSGHTLHLIVQHECTTELERFCISYTNRMLFVLNHSIYLPSLCCT